MSAAGKKITIRIPLSIPGFTFRSLLTLRFALIFFLLLSALAFSYWYTALRPFLWISNAQVESFTSVVSSDMVGKIAEMGPEVGETVQKVKLLFALDRELILTQQKLAQDSVNGCKEEIRSEKIRMEKAMNEYLALCNESESGFDHAEAIVNRMEILEEVRSVCILVGRM